MTERRRRDSSDFVTAREAVALLGVRLPTLYAYVSRGLVRSVPGPRRRDRLYAREDVDRLKKRHDARAGHAAVAADALRFGEPVLDSSITRIEPDGVFYRGVSAIDLAVEATPFEGVADFLWGASDDPRAGGGWGPFRDVGDAGPEDREHAYDRADPRGKTALDRMTASVVLAASREADRRPMDGPGEHARARALLRVMCASIATSGAARGRVRGALTIAQATALALGLPATGDEVRVVDRALVLSADHELNASTFAVRVAASAGCDLYACLTAGLAVLSGSRHGGLTGRLAAFVEEVGGAERAADAVTARHLAGEAIPGFGHRLYPDGDPRARALLETVRARAVSDARLATLLAVVDAVHEDAGEPPALDVGLVAAAYAFGLDDEAARAFFAVGRTAGWVAHALEQRQSPHLLRPRARYVGP